MSSVYVFCWIFLQTFQTYFCIQANSVNPDQTAPRGAVWSVPTLFAEMTFKITSRWQGRRQMLWLAVYGLKYGFIIYVISLQLSEKKKWNKKLFHLVYLALSEIGWPDIQVQQVQRIYLLSVTINNQNILTLYVILTGCDLEWFLRGFSLTKLAYLF